MTSANQRTLSRAVSFDGVGLHTGQACHVEFRPAPPGTGVKFVRTDLPGKARDPIAIGSTRANGSRMAR